MVSGTRRDSSLHAIVKQLENDHMHLNSIGGRRGLTSQLEVVNQVWSFDHLEVKYDQLNELFDKESLRNITVRFIFYDIES